MTTDEFELEVETTVVVRHPSHGVARVLVETGDVGATQGTTLWLDRGAERDVVAQYYPGTRHQERAVQIATGVVAWSYAACLVDDERRVMAEGLARQARHYLDEHGFKQWSGWVPGWTEGDPGFLAHWAVDRLAELRAEAEERREARDGG